MLQYIHTGHKDVTTSCLLTFRSNQIKSHCRGGPAASIRYPGDDLTKPEYFMLFKFDVLLLDYKHLSRFLSIIIGCILLCIWYYFT